MRTTSGCSPAHRGHGLLAVRRLADHLDVRLRVEQRPEPGPHQRLVVGEQYTDHRPSPPFHGRTARTRKPPSSRGPASIVPPRAAARSRMPASPLPLPPASAPVAGSVVVDGQPQHALRVVQPHERPPRSRVPDDVGERFLHDAERGEVGPGGGPRRRAPDVDRQTGPRRLLDQFGQPAQTRRGGPGRLPRHAQGTEHLAHLSECLLARRPDGGEGGPGLLGVRVEERQTHAGLDVDHRDAVGEDVVQLTGDPQPLLVGPPAGGLRPLGPVPGPLLTADPDQLRQCHDGHHPGRDDGLLRPRGRTVSGRRQPAVQPVGHQQVPCPEQSDRGPGRTAVTGHHSAGTTHGDGQEDRPVGVAGDEVHQGDGGRPVRDRHRMPPPPEQQTAPRHQQDHGEDVQTDPVTPAGVGREARTEQDDGGHQQGDRHGHRPSHAPSPRWYRPGGPCRHHGGPPHAGEAGVRCSSMTVTLDGRARAGRPPGEVITRTPPEVRHRAGTAAASTPPDAQRSPRCRVRAQTRGGHRRLTRLHL